MTETERGMFYAIKVPTQEELRGYTCCELSCQEPGIWLMVTGPSPDDFTASCAAHVAELLGDAPLLGITRIEAPAVDYLEVVLDGDPHKGGAFVRVDGAYGKAPERRGTLLPAGGLAPTWVQRGTEHVLRIPVYAGAMFG